ncbi:MAG: tyrosine-protein phosphatase [Acidimicrobiales bacterium]|jgi:protein-tyrosine phosphatase|nr:tyrosine-protein phosphatase [Acidimicrobiales bacterium]
MDSISNFRELGGLPADNGSVAPGRLFRSGHLGAMSDADSARFADHGIRTIVDLRSDGDIESEGSDRVPPGVTHHRVPIFDDAGRGDDLRAIIMRGDIDELREMMGDGRGHQIALDGAAEFVANTDRMASFAQAMAIVTEPDNWPVIWHCSAGKDRAGWVGTSVLLAVGAPTQVIVHHYLQSNEARGTRALFKDGELKDLIRPFLEVHEDYIRAQLAVVNDQWGGVDGLFHDGYGLDAGALDRLRSAVIV